VVRRVFSTPCCRSRRPQLLAAEQEQHATATTGPRYSEPPVWATTPRLDRESSHRVTAPSQLPLTRIPEISAAQHSRCRLSHNTTPFTTGANRAFRILVFFFVTTAKKIPSERRWFSLSTEQKLAFARHIIAHRTRRNHIGFTVHHGRGIVVGQKLLPTDGSDESHMPHWAGVLGKCVF
jgi:hypothetical protein